MAEEILPSRSRVAGFTLGGWLGSHLLLIVGHVALVFLYSVLVAPGLAHAEYAAFAERSGPWFSIVFGGPVFYLVGRILHARLGAWGRRAALAAWVLYSLTDLGIVLAVHGVPGWALAGQWILSQSIKLLAVLAATRAPVTGGSADPLGG